MKNKKRTLTCILTAVCIILLLILWGFLRGHPYGGTARDSTVITDYTVGSLNGMNYELWKDYGDTRMIVNESGTYECEWHDAHSVVFRMGKKFEKPKPISSFGEITLKYGAEYKPKGASYLGVYGWTKDPLAEYYIVENWGGISPVDRPQGVEEWTPLGSYIVNDTEYAVYSSLRENKPSIEGDETTFPQYWSIRTDRSSEGTVCISDHFRIWESIGLTMGDIYEISLAVEGIASSGHANVYLNELSW